MEVMQSASQRDQRWTTRSLNSAGLFRDVLTPDSDLAHRRVRHLKTCPKCRPRFRPKVPSPERLVFLGPEHQVRLRVGLNDAIYTETLPGVSELLIFHPVDTIAKRLMSNKAKVLAQLPYVETRTYLTKGLLPELDHFPRRGFSASV